MMIACITGGSRGIGRAIALRLARDGHDVAITYRSGEEAAKETVRRCQELGVRALALAGDSAVEEDVNRVVETVTEKLGPIEILVNNAGINQDGLAVRMSQDAFNQVVQTDLTGPFLYCRAVMPSMMKKRRGRIINLTSVAGIYGNAGQANYAAAKAGLIGLTKTLAKELAGRSITVNAVAPGFIETDMTDALPDAVKEAAVKAIALKRFGKPEDIAGAVAFLASEEASYITGQVLEISGGLTI